MNECMERLKNGIITENPVFIMALGLCPTFAVTTNATNAIGMGLSSMAVLIFSNLVISLIAPLIPGRVRLPAEIVVVASLVTIVQLLIQGFAPSVYDALGIYIPLIVVNCIILGRAEAYALGAKPIPALFDGIGMGLGFTFADHRRRRDLRHPADPRRFPHLPVRPASGRFPGDGIPDRCDAVLSGSGQGQEGREVSVP